MKAYTTEDGHIVTFRPDLNAARMANSAARLEMPVFPEDRFVDAIKQVVKANAAYVPPYGSGATLYVRPYMFGSSAVIGVKPAEEYQFRVFATPVGPYFKGGAKPITIKVSDFDRAAPHGTGHVKAGLNYAMSLHAIVTAHEEGYDENMYLDAATRTKVEETGGANFIFVTKDNKGGILVPGGFGTRGIDGKLEAIKYARTHNVPFLGLCLGMQLSIVEFARDVLGYNDAHSAELDPNTTHPVIHIMPEQIGIEDIGGTLRLGAYPCVLDKTSKAYEMYGTEQISERHRHRYEVNNDYRDALTSHGMKLSGLSPDGRIVEMIEIPEHPWFIGTQAHPEFKSRPNKPHPLFKGFLAASLAHQK